MVAERTTGNVLELDIGVLLVDIFVVLHMLAVLLVLVALLRLVELEEFRREEVEAPVSNKLVDVEVSIAVETVDVEAVKVEIELLLLEEHVLVGAVVESIELLVEYIPLVCAPVVVVVVSVEGVAAVDVEMSVLVATVDRREEVEKVDRADVELEPMLVVAVLRIVLELELIGATY